MCGPCIYMYIHVHVQDCSHVYSQVTVLARKAVYMYMTYGTVRIENFEAQKVAFPRLSCIHVEMTLSRKSAKVVLAKEQCCTVQLQAYNSFKGSAGIGNLIVKP